MFCYAKYERPESVTYPQIWHRFNKQMPDGSIKSFIVQDVTDERRGEVLDLMTKYFISDELVCKSLGLKDCENSVKNLVILWENVLDEKTALMCLLDEPTIDGKRSKIVGINMTYVVHKNRLRKQFDAEKVQILFNLINYKYDQLNVFDHYGVDRIIAALGLLVVPEYRSLGISSEIIKARSNLTKGLGIKVTSGGFSGRFIQKAAENVGYEIIYSTDYKEALDHLNLSIPELLGQRLNIYAINFENHQQNKLFALQQNIR